MANGSLMKVESIAECSKGSILQCFWPALSDIGYWKPILLFFMSDRLGQVLLYSQINFYIQSTHGYAEYCDNYFFWTPRLINVYRCI